MALLDFQVYSLDREKQKNLSNGSLAEAFKYFQSQMSRRDYLMVESSSRQAGSDGSYPIGFAVGRRTTDKDTVLHDIGLLLKEAELDTIYISRGVYPEFKVK